MPVIWKEINEAFAPFKESCLYAVRAETFFHLAQRENNLRRYRFKNRFYPLALLWRSRHSSSKPERCREYCFICDYAAEPGFGTLFPLFSAIGAPSTLVVNSRVRAARGRELQGMRNVNAVCADDAISQSRGQWQQLWRRSLADYRQLLDACSHSLRPAMVESERVLRTLLVRAYLYEHFYEELFQEASPRAVITHNDFTALSFLAGKAARRYGIPDFTLQHGFPSAEYFPTSASHYLVWGALFERPMREGKDGNTRFEIVGAPRLDSLVHAKQRPQVLQIASSAGGKLTLLFFSQSHTAVFSSQEHDQILSLVSRLAEIPWVRLNIRRHPQQSLRKLRDCSGLDRAHVLPPDASMTDSILAADVVISVNSTAMLEAALLEKPVLQIAFPAFRERLGILRFPLQAHDVESARTVLRRFREPAERAACVASQQSLVQACISEPGRGTETAWRYIRENSGPTQTAVAAGAAATR